MHTIQLPQTTVLNRFSEQISLNKERALLGIAKWSLSHLRSRRRILLERGTETLDPATISSDLYGRYDTILSVDEVKTWETGENEIAATITLKVFEAQSYEYRRLKREVRLRLQKKFGISQVSIELDW